MEHFPEISKYAPFTGAYFRPMVEVVRVELTSYSAAKKLSTYLVCLLSYLPRRGQTRSGHRRRLNNPHGRLRNRGDFSVCLTPHPRPTDKSGATLVRNRRSYAASAYSALLSAFKFKRNVFNAATPSAVCLSFRSPAIESVAPPYPKDRSLYIFIIHAFGTNVNTFQAFFFLCSIFFTEVRCSSPARRRRIFL